MDPLTMRWVQAELTIAMDLYDRCVTGLRLTPVSTKAVDAAASRDPRQWNADPPSTLRVCPVTKSLSGPARKISAPTRSVGTSRRLIA
jgi:transposase InsO family protein